MYNCVTTCENDPVKLSSTRSFMYHLPAITAWDEIKLTVHHWEELLRKHKTLKQYWFNAGPALKTVGQY